MNDRGAEQREQAAALGERLPVLLLSLLVWLDRILDGR
jgi:hypothetical protein